MNNVSLQQIQHFVILIRAGVLRSFFSLSYAVICCPVNHHFSFQVLFMDTDYQKFCIMRCPQAALKRIDSPEIFKQIPLPECLLELITDQREQI
jgi:hypothetical protein